MARTVNWRDPAVSPRGLWLGAAAAPVCWFTQQLLMSSTVSLDCRHHQWIVPAISAVCASVLLLAFFLSWHALRRVPHPGRYGYPERRSRFVGLVGCVMPMLFLVAMTWQGIAGLVYSGCER